MKKALCLLLTLVLCTAVFAGCGGGTSTGDSGSGSSGQADGGGTQETAPAGTPLSDVRVRQALTYAIDMDTIVDTLFAGKAEVATSFTSPGDWLAAGLTTYEYNPEKARELLAEANWPADYTLDVVYYYDDQQTVDLMTVIGQYWSDVGVKAQFRKLEGDLASQLWVAPADMENGPSAIQWDAAYAAVAALVEHEFYDRFSSGATNNSTVPKDAELDALIATSNATGDVAEQKEIFAQIQQAVADNVYAMPLYHQVCFVYTSDLLDMKGADLGNDQFSYEKNILDWTINRDDNTLYTNGGPLEFFEMPVVNPGYYLYQELLFDKLINADGSLTPTDGMLAESYTMSDDGLNLEFVLREGLTWHDGQPLTGEDVKFSVELYLKVPGLNAVAASTFNAIRGAAAYADGSADELEGIAVDGNTVTITFETVAANALTTFAQWPVLPRHALADASPETLQQNSFWQNPIGSGPYQVGTVVLNNYTTLTRWDGYYRQGSGNVDTIHLFASGENDSNLVKNAGAGQIDYAWSKSTDDAEAIEAMNGMQVFDANIRYTRCFYINQFPHEPNIK